jgi:hypothetical protein
VLVGPRVPVLLRQAKVNDVDQVALLSQAPAANPVRVVKRCTVVGFWQCCGSGFVIQNFESGCELSI